MKEMGRGAKKLTMLVLAALFMMLAVAAVAQNQPPLREPVDDLIVDEGVSYSSLTHLINMVGTDAGKQFSDFFDPAPVTVEPFPLLGEFAPRRMSMLGATLADQMAVIINNSPGSSLPAAEKESSAQLLKGIIQEVDGYLRIHMSGRNSRGEWRSYVANVEMSEAVYRAMHTYVSAGTH